MCCYFSFLLLNRILMMFVVCFFLLAVMVVATQFVANAIKSCVLNLVLDFRKIVPITLNDGVQSTIKKNDGENFFFITFPSKIEINVVDLFKKGHQELITFN